MNIIISENQFKNIVNNYSLLVEYSKSIIDNLLAKFSVENPDVDKNLILTYIKEFKKIKDNPNITKKDITQYSFKELQSVVVSNQSGRIKAGKINDGEPSSDANLMYNQNGLRIYRANSLEACIKYGNGYSFCISSRGHNNQYEDFRFTEKGLPFFIFDDTKTSERIGNRFVDPNHLIVIIIYKVEPGTYRSRSKEFITVTDANNQENVPYQSLYEVFDDYPRLNNLDTIFDYVEPSEKEQKIYDLRKIYNDKLDDIYSEYTEGEDHDFIDSFLFASFPDIKTAESIIYDFFEKSTNPEYYIVRFKAIDDYTFNDYEEYHIIKKENLSNLEEKFKKTAYDFFGRKKLIFDTEIDSITNLLQQHSKYYEEVKNLVDEFRIEKMNLKLID